MAATMSFTISTAYNSTGHFMSSNSKPSGVQPIFSNPLFNTFSGLKSLKCEFQSSFFGQSRSVLLRATMATKTLTQNPAKFSTCVQPLASSFKVVILGAAGGIGQPLSLLLKMSPLISDLHLYDIANVKGVVADLSHCNTPSRVLGFVGPAELPSCLDGADVVVVPAGVPRKPGMTRDDLFNINAGIVKNMAESIADHSPYALVLIISNPVNSTVPIASEVLKKTGAHDPARLFGVTTLDVVRANTFVSEKKNLNLIDVDVPVVGGHSGITILPLLSKTRPSVDLTEEEARELTARVRNAGSDVVEAKAGAGSATLSMAYAAARFVEACLRGLDGDGDVYECCYVESALVKEVPFFASRVKLGRKGIEAVIPSELDGLSDYESRELEGLKPELRASIERGIAFVNS